MVEMDNGMNSDDTWDCYTEDNDAEEPLNVDQFSKIDYDTS